ncbi:hypothetical protein EJ05DRAFT_71947 [Pseudovirgaria hyperparasitica]|uniref:Rhodopsin domain-containing protein n=1 Tax=Pseudovirgaria hyperparasitica TaxID=470096 RepID=A0A6A6W177_9PEZI|nr:uncharacterized protein EJ05DRAFT_71947 [Pseudovirgaria hyperparasitica]KAF2756662.1 hypothetical protein EJ05DRAFT_71947 [Pseudovirgaria hyperparasitica]
MILAGVLYTTLVYTLNRIASGGGSNLFEPELFDTFTQEEIDERILGSKIVVISEQAMLCLIYLLKCCMLCMYYRITIGTRQTRLILLLSGYVAVGFIATEVGFFTFCRPFKGYWGMPPPDPQCTTLAHYAITQACFNLSSDVMMLLIAVPMVIRLNLPLKQKLVLALVFSMGTFVIIAAILTKVYNLSDVYDSSYMLWYIRESSVAVYVSNTPMIWPLLREFVPFLRTAVTSAGSRTAGLNSRSRNQRDQDSNAILSHNRKSGVEADAHELNYVKSVSNDTDRTSDDGDDDHSMGHSGRNELRFHQSNRRAGSLASDECELNSAFWGKGDIHQETTIEIQRESVDLESQTGLPRSMSWVSKPMRQVRIEGGERSYT